MTALEFTYSLNKISKSLRPFALKLTKDGEDANDLLQETLLKAFTIEYMSTYIAMKWSTIMIRSRL